MNAFSSRDYWESRLKEIFGPQGTGFIGLVRLICVGPIRLLEGEGGQYNYCC